MYPNNFNKITCTKGTLVKSLLKTIDEASNLSSDNIFS